MEEKIKKLWAKVASKIPLLLCFTGLILMITGIQSYYHKRDNQIEDEKLDSNIQAAQKSKDIELKNKIDISGAVEKPGMYELPNNYRISDVLISAGGLSPKADRTYLSKNINLAQRIYDGMKIYIPEINEDPIISPTGVQININSSTLSELDSLPGVGITTANKIISNRPYQTIEELITRKVISSTIFGKIKNQITVN